MTRAEAVNFAGAWLSDWGRGDIDALLARYSDDSQFTSPKLRLAMDSKVLQGKSQIAQYWHLALGNNPGMEFEVDRAIWDAATKDLVLFYEVSTNREQTRACELLRFDEHGLVVSDEALFGAPV